MIESVTLINFQRHRKRTVEFSPGVTTLVGKSKAGKTAVVRALIWATMNRPRGDHIIRHGKEYAKAILRIDGSKVVRSKSKGKDNTYAVNGKVYRAFSGGVPSAVEKLVNISEVNIQKQLDPPFWFTQSAGQISKSLNQIVNLGAIDEALRRAASEVRHGKAIYEVNLDRLKKAKERLKELGWVPRFLSQLQRLVMIEQSYTETSKSLAGLRRAVGGVVSYSRVAVRTSEATLGALNVARLGTGAVETAARRAELGKLLTSVILSAERASLPIPDITDLSVMRKEADSFAEKRRGLETLLEELTRVEDELCRCQKELVESEVKISATPNKCPTCGQTILRNRLQSSAPISTSPTRPR